VIVFIDKDKSLYNNFKGQLGEQAIFFTQGVRAVKYVADNVSNVSAVVYVFNADTCQYCSSELEQVRRGSSYPFPLCVIYDDVLLAKPICAYGFDDVIHASVFQVMGEVKLQRYQKDKQAHSELLKLRLNIDYYNERDELTGLPNQRKIIETVDNYMRFSYRHSQAIAFISIALDLSNIAVGNGGNADRSTLSPYDRVLVSIVADLQKILYRGMDVIGRVEKDRLLMVLPDITAAGMEVVEERCRSLLLPREASGALRYTIEAKCYTMNNDGAMDLHPHIMKVLSDFNL